MDSSLGLFVLNTVLVPGAALRLHVFEDRYKALMADCIERKLPFGVLLDRKGQEVGDDLDPVATGTTAAIQHVTKLGAGRLYVLASGQRRFRVAETIFKTPYWRAQISYLNEAAGGREARTLRDLALEKFREYLEVLLAGCGADLDAIDLPADAVSASYIIADALQVEPPLKQILLEKATAVERLAAELALLEQETAHLRKLRARKKAGMQKTSATTFVARFSRN